MADVDLEAIRRKHRPSLRTMPEDGRADNWCSGCRCAWPCDTALVLEDYDYDMALISGLRQRDCDKLISAERRIAALEKVVEAARFPESVFIRPYDRFETSAWIAVPKRRFEALVSALAELDSNDG